MEQHVDEGDDGWGWSGNKQQTHLSGWLPEEFPGWKIIFSKDYHLNKGDYSDGAFAALFKPTKANQKKHFNLIVNDENLNPAELIDDVLDGLKNPLDFEFQVFLPPAYSIGSHLIRPDDSKFNLPTVFTSFNLEIRRPDSIIEIEGTSSEIGLFGLAEQLKIDARKNQSMNLIITRDNIFAETISQRVCEDKLESSNCEWIDSKDSVSLVESIIHALEKP
jgi:hypothetical protein